MSATGICRQVPKAGSVGLRWSTANPPRHFGNYRLSFSFQDFRPLHGILSLHGRKKATAWTCLVCGTSLTLTQKVCCFLSFSVYTTRVFFLFSQVERRPTIWTEHEGWEATRHSRPHSNSTVIPERFVARQRLYQPAPVDGTYGTCATQHCDGIAACFCSQPSRSIVSPVSSSAAATDLLRIYIYIYFLYIHSLSPPGMFRLQSRPYTILASRRRWSRHAPRVDRPMPQGGRGVRPLAAPRGPRRPSDPTSEQRPVTFPPARHSSGGITSEPKLKLGGGGGDTRTTQKITRHSYR